MNGGGTFLTQNKVLPGAYINFVSTSRATVNISDRGFAAIATELDWGVDGDIFKVENSDFQKDTMKLFGYDYTDEKMKPLRDLFMKAKTVYLYRLNGNGVKASNDYATAKYSGTRGNDITIIVKTNIDEPSKKDIITMLGTKKVDAQTVANASELIDNDYVVFKKTAQLTDTAGTKLVNGANLTTVTGAEHQKFLDLAENSIRKLIELQDRIINQEDLKIFLATANKHKIDEISDIFSGIENIKILSINNGIEIPEVIEDGETFEENSKKKAVEIAKFLNMITIADDSGLCVDALNGEPGVYSARYSGTGDDLKNNEKLIENLKGVENRKAKFVSVITLAKPNGETYSFRGEIEGKIIDIPKGNTGFGYDPYFYVEEYQKTLAELPELKNKISHRAKALEKLKENLKNIL